MQEHAANKLMERIGIAKIKDGKVTYKMGTDIIPQSDGTILYTRTRKDGTISKVYKNRDGDVLTGEITKPMEDGSKVVISKKHNGPAAANEGNPTHTLIEYTRPGGNPESIKINQGNVFFNPNTHSSSVPNINSWDLT
jgi:hypothetical protein